MQIRRALECFADVGDNHITADRLRIVLTSDLGSGKDHLLSESEACRALYRLTLRADASGVVALDDICATWSTIIGRPTKPATPYDDWQKRSAFRREPRPPPAKQEIAAAAANGRASFELKRAIQGGNLAAVRKALRHADANAGDAGEGGEERTGSGAVRGDALDDDDSFGGDSFPLVWAAGSPAGDDSVTIVRELLKAGADPHRTTGSGEKPVAFVYASRGRHDLLAPLREAVGEAWVLNRPEGGPIGETPLHAACRLGHMEVVRELIRLGADVSLTTKAHKESALWVASRRGHAEMVDALLAAGAPVNVQDDLGETALHQAALFGYPDVLGVLLAAGADPSLADSHGHTPLLVAQSSGNSVECTTCAAMLASAGGSAVAGAVAQEI